MSLQSRYTILRKITDGGTAEIFLAKQHGAQGFEKTVVLKRIFTTFYADPQFRHMLRDEAHVAMSLNHSNIVQVLDLGESEGRYFLALELVDGWTLDRILKRSKAAPCLLSMGPCCLAPWFPPWRSRSFWWGRVPARRRHRPRARASRPPPARAPPNRPAARLPRSPQRATRR